MHWQIVIYMIFANESMSMNGGLVIQFVVLYRKTGQPRSVGHLAISSITLTHLCDIIKGFVIVLVKLPDSQYFLTLGAFCLALVQPGSRCSGIDQC